MPSINHRPSFEWTPCNICGSTESSSYLKLSDRFSNEEFQLVTCKNCGLIYVNPRPALKDIGLFYPEAYEPHSVNSKAGINWHNQRMWRKQLSFVEKYNAGKGKMLDIGCATGDFLATARSNGWSVIGVELDSDAAQIARDRHGLTVYSGPAEEILAEMDGFDVVTMWNVLEHLYDPRAILEHCNKILKPDGNLIFSIPNLSSFDRKIFSESWLGWEVPRHLFYFDETTIMKVLDVTRFELVDSRCFLGDRGVFEISLKTKFAKSQFLHIIETLMPILLYITWPYRRLSYWLKRGSIITYVVRKRIEDAS